MSAVPCLLVSANELKEARNNHPLYPWAVDQMRKDFKTKARAESEAAGWCIRWTQDHDGTLRWGWFSKPELEAEQGHHPQPEFMVQMTGRKESESSRCFRLALEALNDPALKNQLQAFADEIEEDEYQKIIDDAEVEMQSNVIPLQQPEQPELPQNQDSKRANQFLDELMKSNDSELERLATIPQLIDGFIPAQSTGMFYGISGGYKSFLMVAMAASVATGVPFAGCAIDTTGDVVYLAAEGGSGIRKRLKAWEQVHGIKADGVRILPLGLIVDDNKERRLLTMAIDEMVRRTGRKIKMIILDTLSQTTGGDDNSNRDMAAYINACSELKEHFECAVCFVHHTGKTGDGFRGAYALQANIDFQFCVNKMQPLYAELIHEKAKDTEQVTPKRFRMKPVVIEGFHDYKGRPLETLVPVPLGLMEEAQVLTTLTDREQLLMTELAAHVEGNGNLPCDRKALRESFMKALMEKEADLDDETARRAFNRCLSTLSKRHFLRSTKDTVEKL